VHSRTTDRHRQRWLALSGLALACVIAHGAALDRLLMRHESAEAVRAQPAQAIALQARILIAATPPMPAIERQTDVAPTPTRRAAQNAAASASVKSAFGAAVRSVDVPLPAPTPATDYLPTLALDMPPMPRSTPDEQFIDAVRKSGLPIRVRLFVGADGVVSSAELLNAAPGDEESAEQVMAMFRETAFSPGRLAGEDVPAFIDIEVVLEPSLSQLIP
jgi:hypothetical protein